MMLRSVLAVTLFLGYVGAEDPIVVKGKTGVVPKFCHKAGEVRYQEDKRYPEATEYALVLKCDQDPDCETMVIRRDSRGEYTASVIIKGEDPDAWWGNFIAGGEIYKRQEGDDCPEGYRQYEVPPTRFTKLFCKYEDSICTTKEKIGDPIKTKNAYFCMKKCIAEPSCSAVAYINNKAITNRCQLLEGHCRTEDLRHFHNGEHYSRLLITEKKCPNMEKLKPFCADGDEEVVSVEYGSIKGNPTAGCPDNHVLTRCECQTGNFGGYFGAQCKGVRMTYDGKSCTTMHKAKPKYIRARACCRPVRDNERVQVVSQPEQKWLEDGAAWFEHVKVTCPPDMHIIGCSGYREQALDVKDKFTVGEDGRSCNAARVEGKAAVQAVCIGTHEMGPVRSGQCLENEKEVVSADTPVASCESGSFVSQCSCEVVSGSGFCAGAVVSAGATKCQAYGSDDGVTVKAKVCCAPLGVKEAVVVTSVPESLTTEVKTGELSQAPYTLCPKGTQLVFCSFYSSVEGQKAYSEGSRCWAAWKCTSCGVQAVCKKDLPEPQGPWKCDEGDEEVVSESFTTSGFTPAVALCPFGSFITKCTCQPVTEGETCEYVGAHANQCLVKSDEIKELKARGCCRVQKEDEVISVQQIESWRSFKVAPHVSCPEGSKVVSCILHTQPPSQFVNERAIVDGTSCSAASTCTKCAVIAICSTTIEKVTFDKRECTDDETEVVSSGVATGSGTHAPFATAICPSGHWLNHCQCLAQTEGAICDAARISPNGRKCMARGTAGGTKAKGCCKRVSGKDTYKAVSSRPGMLEDFTNPFIVNSYSQAPSVGCPEKTSLVTCFVDSPNDPTVARVAYTQVGTEKCFSGPECTKCGITAICKGIKNPVQKCTKFEKEVTGAILQGSYHPGHVTCEEGYYVRSCACDIVEFYGPKSNYCMGTGASLDGRTCNVYSQADWGIKIKAKACCAKLKKNEDVFGISDPTRMLTGTQNPVFEGRGPFVECPPKTRLVGCYLKMGVAPQGGGSRTAVEYYVSMPHNVINVNNRCEAPYDCLECGISAVCKGPKKLIAKLRWY